MAEISVIVPVYQSEKSLCRCINSILNQTFSDIELILVDDGSSDYSPQICDEYAEKDSRIRVIHQENSGVSAARNAALAIASGDYIMFCDSDDYVDQNWCADMYSLALRYPNAWINCQVDRVYHNKERANANTGEVREITFYELHILNLSGYPVNKIYSAQKLKKFAIRFPTNYVLGEDINFNVQYCKHSSEYILYDKALYHYVYQENSASQQYRADKMEKLLPTFREPLDVLENEYLVEFCDGWMYRFLGLFDATFDKRNHDSLLNKFRYNQRMIESREFQFCVSHCSDAKTGRVIRKILSKKNYALFYTYKKMYSIYRKLRR